MLKSFFKSLALLSLAATLLVVPLSGFSSPEPEKIPEHIHPALVKEIKSHPDKLVSVIVGTQQNKNIEQQIRKLGGKITANWKFINSLAVEISARKLIDLANIDGVKMVTVDGIIQSNNKGGSGSGAVETSALANAYNYSIKADKVWNKGYDGTGITVAIVDSGISAKNGADDFGQRLIGSVKFNSNAAYATDKYGHGSHVAGIIGGDGSASRGKFIGVAPGVNLINVKFSGDDGSASEQDLVNALQWVYDNRKTYNIRVVNISSNVTTKQSYKESAVAAAVEQLWFAGVVVVVSAGNNGGTDCSVCYAPANDPYVITVGAVDDNGTKQLEDDYMKSWSSYGKTLDGHNKPDVVAPGARIISYMPTGILRDQNRKSVVSEYYFRMGGTSMAAPMVTGVVALMLQVNPHLTPDEVKWIIQNTTRTYQEQIPGTPGIITADFAAFYSGTPGKANQGLTPSPLLDPGTQTISYSNMAWANMAWANMAWANSHHY